LSTYFKDSRPVLKYREIELLKKHCRWRSRKVNWNFERI